VDRELPTLITSNVKPADLKPILGDRVTSRLVEMTTRVVLKGDDRRRGGQSKGAA
jgi:DNA replication protein DnaC